MYIIKLNLRFGCRISQLESRVDIRSYPVPKGEFGVEKSHHH